MAKMLEVVLYLAPESYDFSTESSEQVLTNESEALSPPFDMVRARAMKSGVVMFEVNIDNHPTMSVEDCLLPFRTTSIGTLLIESRATPETKRVMVVGTFDETNHIRGAILSIQTRKK